MQANAYLIILPRHVVLYPPLVTSNRNNSLSSDGHMIRKHICQRKQHNSICDRAWENRSYVHINWIPLFACTWKLHSCTIQKHQELDNRWPGLLSQMDAVKPRGCISRPWGALIGLHEVPSCSWRQSWPTLWIVPVLVPYWMHSTAAWVQMVALAHLRFPTRPRLPPSRPPTPYRLNPWYYRHWQNLSRKPAAFKEIAIKW